MKKFFKTYLIFIFLTSKILTQELSLLNTLFPINSKLIHKIPSPFFLGRPYFLEIFCDIPTDSLESISVFYKTDGSIEFREEKLELFRGRYRFKYDPKIYPSKQLSYFFIVKVKKAGMYAFPVNNKGKLIPINIESIDPIKYYKNRIP